MGADVRGFEDQILFRLEFHARIPLLVAWIFQMLVDGGQSSEVHLVGIKLAKRSDSLCLRWGRAGNEIRQRISTRERADVHAVNEWSGELNIGDRILIDEVVRDSIAAPKHQFSMPRIPRETQTRAGVPISMERIAPNIDTTKRA